MPSLSLGFGPKSSKHVAYHSPFVKKACDPGWKFANGLSSATCIFLIWSGRYWYVTLGPTAYFPFMDHVHHFDNVKDSKPVRNLPRSYFVWCVVNVKTSFKNNFQNYFWAKKTFNHYVRKRSSCVEDLERVKQSKSGDWTRFRSCMIIKSKNEIM